MPASVSAARFGNYCRATTRQQCTKAAADIHGGIDWTLARPSLWTHVKMPAWAESLTHLVLPA